MLPVFADTAAVQQLGEEKKGFRVSDTGVLEELGERFGQSLHMRRRRPGVVHAVYLMKGMSVANECQVKVSIADLHHDFCGLARVGRTCAAMGMLSPPSPSDLAPLLFPVLCPRATTAECVGVGTAELKVDVDPILRSAREHPSFMKLSTGRIL